MLRECGLATVVSLSGCVFVPVGDDMLYVLDIVSCIVYVAGECHCKPARSRLKSFWGYAHPMPSMLRLFYPFPRGGAARGVTNSHGTL